MEPVRVLLVEDSEPDARLIREILRSAGAGAYTIDHAEDLASALERLAAGGVDVVLLDLCLPDSIGLDAVSRIRGSSADVPIVVLTGLADQAAGKQAVRDGAEDYLVKGRFEAPLLERAIQYAIERHRRQADLERVNRELAAQRDQLAEAQREKAELTALVVHDLKNPITVVRGGIEAVLERPVSDELRQTLERSLEVCHLMNRMVMNLLDIDRSEHGKLEPDRTEFDLVELAHEICQRMATRARQLDHRLELSGGADELPVRADRDILRRVMENLVDNAFKYAPRGTRVTLTLTRSADGGASIAVSDEGPGIPPELMGRIFEKYVSTAVTGVHVQRDSRGLGLAFCRKAVVAHGGTIEAANRDPRGAVFTVVLPGSAA